jgi:hypothetical protein
MEGFDAMNDAPKKIWAWDFMVSKQNEFMTGGWHNETEDIDSDKETEYTRSDIAQARIEKLEAALRFYNEGVTAFSLPGINADVADQTLDRDGGKQARAALKETP